MIWHDRTPTPPVHLVHTPIYKGYVLFLYFWVLRVYCLGYFFFTVWYCLMCTFSLPCLRPQIWFFRFPYNFVPFIAQLYPLRIRCQFIHPFKIERWQHIKSPCSVGLSRLYKPTWLVAGVMIYASRNSTVLWTYHFTYCSLMTFYFL